MQFYLCPIAKEAMIELKAFYVFKYKKEKNVSVLLS